MPRLAPLAVLLAALPAFGDGSTGLGTGIVACGDLDKDGVTDLLVASRDNRLPEVVWLVSGKDGSVIHVFRGPDDSFGFGFVIDAPCDLDGDGLPEIAISVSGTREVHRQWQSIDNGLAQPSMSGVLSRGVPRCEIFSSRSHALLFALPGAGRVSLLKHPAADGGADLLFAVPGLHYGGGGQLSVFSGKDGTKLRELPMPEGCRFQNCAIALGDIDADGFADIVAAIGDGEGDSAKPGALLLSGKDGHLLWKSASGPPDKAGRFTLRCPGDLDRDGVPDVLEANENAWVRALSGKDGHVLYEVGGPAHRAYTDQFGSSIDTLGDLDGDGVCDWGVAANEQWGGTWFDQGYVWIRSGKDGRTIRNLVTLDRENGYDVCALGDADGDKTQDVAILIENARLRWSVQFNPILRVVSTKDGHTLWEKDIRTLRAVRDDLKATPESGPGNPAEENQPR